MKIDSPFGRFDDLRSGESWVFPEVAYSLVATRLEQVVPVLAEVERVTELGRWAFGFVAYEAAPGLDHRLPVQRPMAGLPLVWFGVCAEPQRGRALTPPVPGLYRTDPWRAEWSSEQHHQRVQAVREQIAAGETYQCNLTTRLSGRVTGDLSACYADLALAQGGAYNAYLDLGRFAIASASPELFFENRDGDVHMRPIKGTASRGRDSVEDAALLAALRSSRKEHAENVMIVDLVRNDLARVAVTGSVRVTSLCRAEQFETVHQLISDVGARLRPGTGLVEMFQAMFPCGSVTGAPKPRTMRLIQELEDSPRGVYCGAVGMLAPAGASFRARFNVAIRTLLIDRETGAATYGTGGGITWDSVPAAEYAELWAKAAVLRRLGKAPDNRVDTLVHPLSDPRPIRQ
ncbi:aminodeoxychorismate synthase component I [Nocardia sp. NPDC051911]|uniref:aminodeoxychorismate synthase component I n=1 Tax=Nocardia sp. NPDC051911 TaxID=3154648 RepID=UPI003425D11B